MNFNLFPKSFFGRNTLVIAILLIISQFISFVTVQHFVVDQKNRIIMYLVANQIKLQFLGSTPNIPRNVSVGISKTTEMELYLVNGRAIPKGLQRSKKHDAFTQSSEQFLGKGTIVNIEVSDRVYVWVNKASHPDYWIRMPIAEYDGRAPISLLIFSSMLLFLSLLGGWILVGQLHRPLKHLARAAREVGRGDYPIKLKETGPQELVEVTSAFNQMSADVHKLEEERSLLLAGISHDLRTPITRLRLSLEFLSEQDEDIKQGLIDDTQDMDDIIDQFIGYVRYGNEEKIQQGNILELIQLVVENSRKVHAGIETDFNEEQFRKVDLIKFKPLAMKRLVSNLIENAFRYGKAPVLVSCSITDKVFKLSVHDRGDGIKDIDKARLFQPFTRGDQSRGGKGSGLGLAIVQRIAEMHQGDIQLNNHPDGGFEASFIMPIV